MSNNERTFMQSLWDFFCSLKLTIFLLISLAVTSIIGTVLPQGQLPPEYVAQTSQTKLQIYSKLGFFDMYHSWWFILLLYIFSMNLIACSIKRLPHVFKFISEPMLTISDTLQKSMSLSQDLKFTGSIDTAKETLAGFLKSEFTDAVITQKDGEFHLFAQKTAWCRLGVYVVHFSIIVIFIGAIIGSLFGYKGFVNIVEGTAIDTVDGRNGQPIPLGFGVKCEQFTVSYYPTGAPKEFKSILTVLENGIPVPDYTNVRTVVNTPLTYKGVTFYQSSYGPATEGALQYVTVTPKNGGETEKLAVRTGEPVRLKDGSTFKVIESTEEVRQVVPDMNGPAARIEYTPKGGQPQIFIVFKNFPEVTAERNDNHLFTYVGTDAKFYTGLQVAKDPGVWVVWTGCALMCVGLYIAFFMSHRRIWIVVSKGYARMYGNASKNHAVFQGQFEEMAAKLKELKI